MCTTMFSVSFPACYSKRHELSAKLVNRLGVSLSMSDTSGVCVPLVWCSLSVSRPTGLGAEHCPLWDNVLLICSLFRDGLVRVCDCDSIKKLSV